MRIFFSTPLLSLRKIKFEIRNKSTQCIRVPGNQGVGYQSSTISGKNRKEEILKPDIPIS
jgi:hypothetical protein